MVAAFTSAEHRYMSITPVMDIATPITTTSPGTCGIITSTGPTATITFTYTVAGIPNGMW